MKIELEYLNGKVIATNTEGTVPSPLEVVGMSSSFRECYEAIKGSYEKQMRRLDSRNPESVPVGALYFELTMEKREK